MKAFYSRLTREKAFRLLIVFLFIGLWITLLSGCFIGSQKDNNVSGKVHLVGASSDNFPPVNMLDSQGELIGFGRDLSDAVIEAAGGEVTHIHSAYWLDVLDMLAEGEADFIHDTGYTPERDEFLDYSDPIIEMPEVIFVRSERWDITSFDSLRDKKVACVNQHITHLYLQTFPWIECVVVKTPVEGVYTLVSGDVDAFIYPEQIALYLIQELRLMDKIKITGEPIRTLTWSMTVREGDQETLNILNEGLRIVRQSGEYDRIYNKWWGEKMLQGYTKRELQTIIILSVGAALSIMLALSLFLFNRRLYKEQRALEAEILERKQTEKALMAAQKMADLGTLSAGVAHEINSPLQVVTSLSAGILKKINEEGCQQLDEQELTHRLEMIQRNGWRMAQIVRALLTYANASLEQAACYNLNEIVRETLPLIENQLQKNSDIKIIVDYAGDLPPVYCDRNQISQVIINLLTNARDAIVTSGTISIVTASDPQKKTVLLKIADNGSGISPEVKSRIFDPFFTTKDIGSGAGLGLSIVSGIIHSHGGEIEVESELYKGTTFTIHLPLNAENAIAAVKNA